MNVKGEKRGLTKESTITEIRWLLLRKLRLWALRGKCDEWHPKFHTLKDTYRSTSLARTWFQDIAIKSQTITIRVLHEPPSFSLTICTPSLQVQPTQSLIDSVRNRSSDYMQQLPQCSQCWLGLACHLACCRGKLVQDIKIGYQKYATEQRTACMIWILC